MDQQKKGLFGNYSSTDPTMNVPVTATPSSMVSPYMNFDPAYINPNSDSDFIMPEGAGSHRGRFETAFSKIGASVFIGGIGGGGHGLYEGVKNVIETKQTGKVRRTVLLNHIAKQGASHAQAMGVIALMYSGIGLVFSKARGDVHDEISTVVVGTATGLLYKSASGLRNCAAGGVLGLTVSLGMLLLNNKEKIKGRYK